MTKASLLIAASYLIGSIPFGLVLGRFAGIDVRKAGSGNIGATNVNRLLGKKMGAITLAGDALKALLPTAAAAWFFREAASRELVTVLCGGAAFLGHLYPVYLRFQGGKGVATALGLFLYLQPFAVLAAVLLFGGVVALSGYVSMGSLAASAAMPLLVWLLGGTPAVVWLATVVAVFVWIKHRSNIVRLLKHEENSWKTRWPT